MAEPTEEQITDRMVNAATRALDDALYAAGMVDMLDEDWASETARKLLVAAYAATPKPKPQLAVDTGSCIWVADADDYWRNESGGSEELYTAEELAVLFEPIEWYVPAAGQIAATPKPQTDQAEILRRKLDTAMIENRGLRSRIDALEDDASPVAQQHLKNHCPTCDSPSPSRHPATGYEGEVYKTCPDQWHEAGQRLETENQP